MSKGQSYNPIPLDFQLLERLPEKAILGGVHWAGKRARHLQEAISAGLPEGVPLTSGLIQARLRSMKVAGYTEDFAATGGRIWARTEAGTAYLATKEEVLG